MTAKLKIASMLMAAVLSCQGPVPAIPAETEPTAATEITEAAEQTLPETEPQDLLADRMICDFWLPFDCFQPAPEGMQGTVLIDQVPGHEECPHRFTVYLPPQYEAEGQYDLLIFLGPSDGEMGDCINVTWDTWYTNPFKFSDIFDQLILQKRVRPFIVVQPDYLNWLDMEAHYDHTALSIKEELLPYVAENYPTYAESGAYEDLVAARDHIAMGGASLGGMHTFRGLLKHCTDVSAFFCPMSCNIDMMKVTEDIRTAASRYPVSKLCYTVGGIEEVRMKQMPDHVKTVLPEVLNDRNMVVIQVDKTHHFYSTWAVGLWNSLQYFFRPSDPPA